MSAERFHVVTHGTTWDGTLEFEVDDVIAATGFRTPLQDLPGLGLVTVADDRIPALTPWWESVSLPGAFFAGNASQGARGLGKRGAGASSSSVNGFRYNARVLAEHLARRLAGWEPPHDRWTTSSPSCCTSSAPRPTSGCRRATSAAPFRAPTVGWRDEGVMPLAIYLDAVEDDGAAASVEVDERGTILPTLYLRDRGEIGEHQLDPHPLHEYERRALPQARRCARRLTWRKTGSPRESAPP